MTETKFLEEHTVEKNNVTGYVEVCISCVPLDYSKAEKIKEILESNCKYICHILCASEKNKADMSGWLLHCKYFIPFFSKNYFLDENWQSIQWQLETIQNRSNTVPVFLDNITWKDLDGDQNKRKKQLASLLAFEKTPIQRTTLLFYGIGIEDIQKAGADIIKTLELLETPANDSENENDVFISYAHANKELVLAVYNELDKQLNNLLSNCKCCWIDRERLSPGIEYDMKILNALDKSKCVLVFFSKEYMQSPYCTNKELSTADICGKPIIPVFVDEWELKNDKPSSFAEGIVQSVLHYSPISYRKGVTNEEKDISEICKSIINSPTFMRAIASCDKAKWGTLHDEHIFKKLILHLEKMQYQHGNYLSVNNLCGYLFPDLKCITSNTTVHDESNDQMLAEDTFDSFAYCEIVSYDVQKQNSIRHLIPQKWHDNLFESPLVEKLDVSKHLYLVGEGGFGKTTTLVETCRYLLNCGEYAIYVPLKKLNCDISGRDVDFLSDYIRTNIFDGNTHMFAAADAFMAYHKPFYIFLDGLNEMPTNMADRFIEYLETTFIPKHPSVKLVVSSRYNSTERFGAYKKDFTTFQFQDLTEAKISQYIEESQKDLDESVQVKNGERPRISFELIKLLHTPLMLILYCDTLKLKQIYEDDQDPNVKGKIHLEPSKTPANILNNYFQTQIYRALKERTFDEAIHLTVIEYMLPLIAWNMVYFNQKEGMHENEFKQIVQAPFDQQPYFEWYQSIRQGGGEYTHQKNKIATETIERELAFLNKTLDNNNSLVVSFSHNVFCDYFAAIFLRMEIKYLNEKRSKKCLDDAFLGFDKYPDEILSFLVDLLNEKEHEPCRINNKWTYKSFNITENNQTPSKSKYLQFRARERQVATFKGSLVEDVLSLWRDTEGAPAQNAVYNLFNILRIGRNDNLFTCDFSYLDLRACNLKGVKFSEFDKDNTYATSFEGAWIDKECFLPNGHSAPITAMYISSDNILYTGDVTGKVFRWNLNDLDNPSQNRKVDPDGEFEVTDDKIIRLALSELHKSKLLVLTDHSVTEFDVERREVIKCTSVPPHKYLRDVRDNAGVIEVIYDTAPLTWCSLDDNKTDYLVDDSCPISGCIRKSPCSDVYVYSDMNGQIRTNEFGFYSLRQHLRNDIKRSIEEDTPLDKYYILKNSPRINDICWHSSGEKLLVVYSNTVFEFAYTYGEGLRYITHVTFDQYVSASGYTRDNRMIVCEGMDIRILARDDKQKFFDADYNFSNYYVPKIKNCIQQKNLTYFLSSNNEFKILDETLTVIKVRQLSRKVRDFCFARNIEDGKKFVCLLLQEESMVRFEKYDPDLDEYSILSADFEFVQNRDDHSDKPYSHFVNYNKLISFHRETATKYEYENCTGINVQSCCFKNIRGSIAKYLEMLKKNGGEI